MKKTIMLLAAVCVTLVGFTIGTNAQASVDTKSFDCDVNMRCTFCNGTGFKGNFNCFHCKGTGRNSSY